MAKDPNRIDWLWKLQRAGASRVFGAGRSGLPVLTVRDEAIYCRKPDGRDGTDSKDLVIDRIRDVHDVLKG